MPAPRREICLLNSGPPALPDPAAFQFFPGLGKRDVEDGFAAAQALEQKLQGERGLAGAGIALR